MNEISIKYPTRPGRLVCFALHAMLAAIALFVFLPQRALAAGVVGDGTPGSCTETALDAALAGGGSVTFYCGNTLVAIPVTSQKLITADTTIDGGERVTLDGNDATRLFYINTSVALTLTNLAISGGNGSSAPNSGYGGGIFNNGGSLSVINSTIADNHATEDGGGIYNTGGPLLVMNSTFYNNTTAVTGAGGGIEIVNSAADVSNSTFSENSATYGGGIDIFLNGSITTLNVFNSTFSGNSASDSGGGIRNNDGTVTLKNTIVANNVSVVGNCTGAVIDGGGNLQYGGGTDDSCSATIPTSDPKLSSLADNGGPAWTMALQAGSAALDAADDSTCVSSPVNDLDQRGSPRSVDSQCDIGAFEYDASQAGPVFTVNDIAGADDGVCGVGNCRLREAINAANLHAGADTIELAAGATYTLTMVDNFDSWSIGSGLPVIASDITINAHGATISRSQAGDTPLFRHFYVTGGGILRLNQATVRGGDAAGRYGGGIFIHGGMLIVADSTISNNAARSGGGIEVSGVITMTRSTLSNNTAYWGGGINNLGQAILVNSTFSGNSATEGGGICNSSKLTVINSTVAGNSAADGGGIYSGIYIGSAFTLKNVIVANSGGENCYGPVIDGGGNLQYGGSTPDSCGVTIPTGDPQLGLLADNGGFTWTMALMLGSAAIDAADDATCAVPPVNNLDQRGVTRPIGAHCDIGAYEAEFPYDVFLPLIQRE